MPAAFELITRSIIIRDGQILLCRAKGKGHYFFPGGHVEFGESAEAALRRELREELGTELSGVQFVGAAEHTYRNGEGQHHELNLVFRAELIGTNDVSREAHLTFEWVTLAELSFAMVLPRQLAAAVGDWLVTGHFFWQSFDFAEES